MNKQTFQIPDGCRSISVEQVGNQIITTFEREFKRGDVLIYPEKSTLCVFKQYTQYNEFETYINNTKLGDSFWATECFRHATPEEAQRLWDALAKDGKRWNPETMEVEEIKKERWRAKKDKNYWMIQSEFAVKETYDTYGVFDTIQYYSGNYFQTEEQALRAVDRLQKLLAEFWEEELK